MGNQQLIDNHATGNHRLMHKAESLLALADIRINGDRPWDIQVHDDRFYSRVFAHGSLGLGESYMDGWWDCDQLDVMVSRLLRARIDDHIHDLDSLWMVVKARLTNMQHGKRSWKVGQQHYDLGNDLFDTMLGRRLVYSCGYWAQASNLDDAQEAKLDLVCRKLGLQPGMKVLDIGCGWGEALKYACENYGVRGVGVTISAEQAEYARKLCDGLDVEIRLEDYQVLDEHFDRIFSIGMFEHVGEHNYHRYFKVARRCLAPDGLMLLHTIGCNRKSSAPDTWIEKYIFPNSQVPSSGKVVDALEDRFVVEDWHNFGPDYDRTLCAWMDNFNRAWPELSQRYDERFRRMWLFYLCVSAASFRSRRNQLWQILLSPEGVPGGLRVPR